VRKEKLAVMFVIDKSYSIHDDLFLEARQLVHDVADILFDNSNDVKLGALVFDGIQGSFPPTDSLSAFHTELDALTWTTEDYTKVSPALSEASTVAQG
jgi:hypothetical protein